MVIRTVMLKGVEEKALEVLALRVVEEERGFFPIILDYKLQIFHPDRQTALRALTSPPSSTPREWGGEGRGVQLIVLCTRVLMVVCFLGFFEMEDHDMGCSGVSCPALSAKNDLPPPSPTQAALVGSHSI
jgi:hypothetical protein